MIKRILLPLDGSSVAQRAMPIAVHLASMAGARLTLMHGRASHPTATSPEFDIEAFALTLRESEAVGALTDQGRVQVEVVLHDVYGDRAAEAICESAAEQQADLIVMSTHGYGGPGHSIYGSVAEQVVCQSPIPIVLVPTMDSRPWPAQAPCRILVPLDGSRFAEEALGSVEALAAAMRADLILIGAIDPASSTFAGSVSVAGSGFETELHDMREYLNDVADRLRPSGLTIRTDAEVGQAAAVIDGAAQRRHIDLIAMATHGRSGVAKLALGSVASATLQRSTIPLLLVRPAALRQRVTSATALAAPRQRSTS
jgi:nucleotide-binding universal stress UspA family protein